MIAFHRTLMLAAALLLGMVIDGSSQNANAQVAPGVVKQGKRATAMVVLPESSGTAFCISSFGFFITNAHVVEEIKPGQTVTLVLNPGEEEEARVRAVLIKADAEMDLALLRIDKPRQLTALYLGDSDQLVETASVAAFGYPFGKDLALENQEFPAVTVSTGHITALRKFKGQLQQLQLDASINPGNSGGPVIDSKGKVVGVVQDAIDGANINIAIPVTVLRKFLSAAQIIVRPMNIVPALMTRKQEFTIQLLPVLRSFNNPTVQLKLTVFKHATRVYDAVASSTNRYRVSAVPAPPGEIESFVKITIRDKDKDYSYHIRDVPVSIGRVRLNLGDLRYLEPQTNRAVNKNGREIIGPITGLTNLVAEDHGVESMLNFSRVSSMHIEPLDPDVRSLAYEVVVKQGGSVVLDTKGDLLLGLASSEQQVGAGPGITAGAGVLYDGFNYAPGETVVNQNGGIGWGGAWNQFGASNGRSEIVAESLSFDNLKTSGNSMKTAGYGTVGHARNFRPDARFGSSGTVMWVSFLMKPLENVTVGQDIYFAFVFGNIAIGKGGRSEYYGLESPGARGTYYTTRIKPATYRTDFLVAKFTFRDGADKCELWINPKPGASMSTMPDAVKEDIDTGIPADFNIGSSISTQFDEIRFGRTYGDVAPVK